MGRDKTNLRLGSRTLIERAWRAVDSVAEEILVSVRGPVRHDFPGARPVPDRLELPGPLAGLDALLRAARFPALLLVGCDMPFLNPALLRHLATRIEGFEAVVPEHGGRLQPLHAVYATSCRPALDRYVRDGGRSLVGLLETLRFLRIPPAEIEPIDPEGLSFLNVNTPADRALAERVLSSGLPRFEGPLS
jgi:molybdopterin-guanine dinucleotide biosynthesis protein A